nr:VanW family protein [uncultured Porphyromonas sp.]
MIPQEVESPIKRGKLRHYLGREFYILKRKLRWLCGSEHYARIRSGVETSHLLFEHQSTLLRRLKDVDMELQYNKITNLRLAVAKLDGVVIRPGETFSIWRLVGRPSARKGYLEGMVLHNGKVQRGVGGGLCQLGNLLYWITLHSPLSVQERWRHSFDVFPDVQRTIPFACGATLSYNYIDLVIRNNTEHTFSLHLWLDEEFLHGTLSCDAPIPWEYEVFETDPSIRQQWWGGYTRHNKIWRKVRHKATKEETTELISENHAIMMYNPYLEQGK